MKSKSQKVRTHSDLPKDSLKIGGWLDGKQSYLSFTDYQHFSGSLSGQKLYRLCKAIVKRFEEDGYVHRD